MNKCEWIDGTFKECDRYPYFNEEFKYCPFCGGSLDKPVKTPDELLEYDEKEIEKGIAENKALIDAIENEEKLTHEQVFDLWFEMPFITGLRSTWCKVSSFSGYIYFFITFVDGVLEQRGFSLERLQQLPHAKIPPRG